MHLQTRVPNHMVPQYHAVCWSAIFQTKSEIYFLCFVCVEQPTEMNRLPTRAHLQSHLQGVNWASFIRPHSHGWLESRRIITCTWVPGTIQHQMYAYFSTWEPQVLCTAAHRNAQLWTYESLYFSIVLFWKVMSTGVFGLGSESTCASPPGSCHLYEPINCFWGIRCPAAVCIGVADGQLIP